MKDIKVSKKIYVVVDSGTLDLNDFEEVFAFDTKEKAMKKKEAIQAEIEDHFGRNTEGYDYAESDNGFEAYEEGNYNENHWCVYIHELEVM